MVCDAPTGAVRASLRVLSETELIKPVSDLLHRGSAPD